MQYCNKFYLIFNHGKVTKALERAIYQSEIEKEEIIKYRLQVITFYQIHGLKLTQEAYGVKRSTLYNWQKNYNDFGIIGLANKSRCPKNKRKSKVREEVIEYIKNYRLEYGNIHQDEIKPHLDDYCKKYGIESVSTATIGRIIKRLKEKGDIEYKPAKMGINGKTGSIHEIKKKKIYKERRKGAQANKPGDIIQADSIHLMINGHKRYIITCEDIYGRMAYASFYDKLNSKNTRKFFEEMTEKLPFEIKAIQTDNGSEFYSYADDYLKDKNIKHYWNYPRQPKSNAFIERFNRTVKEQFVYRNEIFLDDLETANIKLKEWLFWYNTKRHHKGLNYQTPFDFFLSS